MLLPLSILDLVPRGTVALYGACGLEGLTLNCQAIDAQLMVAQIDHARVCHHHRHDAGEVFVIFPVAFRLLRIGVRLYTVPAGDHFIVVKFRKDSSQSTYNDSLQFKIEVV